ncbi:hypothetical protein SEA_CRACKLEWINK_123 [Mycobacterium phage Cracklewink]|uniref:Uncharacterized protein n=1 Tax=Mycobacterium phage Bipper TaxID=1805457 RepID=A0A142F2Q1_9CAUD|nr:hypothetical protein KCH39_gp054 [Mycobacterium phage Bipper]AMQ67058.1 hypothetical protein SEA_BIPPER_123 [Mycobacterium phage Bipper]QDF19409.1 hypothetical protein SEA_CRACKLEWINK_123 [Mycobacterium phage Cracklewink]
MTTTNRVCYYTNESFYNRDQRGYEVAKVTENEAGYVPCFGLYPTPDAALAAADQMNAPLGLTRDDVLAIVASSMAQGPVGGQPMER